MAFYIVLKAALYISWSYVGVRWLSPDARGPVVRGIALGAGRIAIGWVVGAAITPLVLVAGALGQLSLFYFTGLALVRWLEWGGIQLFIPRSRLPADLLTAGDGPGRLWRSIGVVLSYLADAPFLLTHGFPQGRFFC